MEFRVLGPVELWVNGRRIDLGPAKTRLLLAVLLLEAGRTVNIDTLVYRVWDEAIPAKVNNSVQSSLSRLRGRLAECGDPQISLTHVAATGYRLVIPAESVDVLEFNRLANQARAAADRGEKTQAIALLSAAEQLVRGQPLAGLPGPWAQSVRAGLEERHHAVTLQRIGLQLDAEDPRTLIAELREIAGHHPFDEAVAGLLMRALNAAGRSADALAEYAAIARRLSEEKGMSPHPPLRELQRIALGEREISQPSSVLRPPRPAGPASPVAAPAKAEPVSPEAPEFPNTLDRDPPNFVGREEDLAYLTHEVMAQLHAGQSALCVIDGMPGAGKSTLALRLAYLLRKHCPDGALHLNLRGHDTHQSATSSETALDLLLGMLQTDAHRIQHASGLDHAIALWRRHTSNKRLLILLDDAVSAEQLLPLIPGGSGSIVLVTARTHLADLSDAIRHALPLMRPRDARALFAQSARLTAIDDSADGAAIDAVVAACGRLPLALSIAGGSLRMRPSWSISDLVEHLSQSSASAQSDTLTTRITAAFDTSYRDLPDLPRRLFRRLAMYPGSRISWHSAAALADASPAETNMALTILVDHHLITEPKRHFYGVHELLRRFAAYSLNREESEDERNASMDRLLFFTLATVESATKLFHPYRHINLAADTAVPPSVFTVDFTDVQQAAAWLDSEQATLRSVIEYWHAHGHALEAAALSHMLSLYLDRRSIWKEGGRLHRNALDTWSLSGHALGQAAALTDLATTSWRLEAYDQAICYCHAAETLWSSLGDTGGLADVLLQLGRIHSSTHQHPEAIDCFQRCAALREAEQDNHGLSVALYHLGAALFDVGRPQDGITQTQRALLLARAIHDKAVERNSLNNLGEIFNHLGDYYQAEVFYGQALDLARQLGDSRNIAVASLNLGDAHTRQGFPETALPLLVGALETFRQLETGYGQVSTLLAMSRARLRLREHRLALSLLEEAKVLADRLGDSQQLAKTNLTAGDIYLTVQDFRSAERSYRSALEWARSAKAPLLQAEAHQGLGDALETVQGPAAARIHWRHALDLYLPAHPRQAELLRARLVIRGRETG